MHIEIAWLYEHTSISCTNTISSKFFAFTMPNSVLFYIMRWITYCKTNCFTIYGSNIFNYSVCQVPGIKSTHKHRFISGNSTPQWMTNHYNYARYDNYCCDRDRNTARTVPLQQLDFYLILLKQLKIPTIIISIIYCNIKFSTRIC